MKIDGYIPADDHVALEEGSTFVYTTDYGDIRIISKIADDTNKPFANAIAKAIERNAREEKMRKQNGEGQLRRIINVFAEHCILSWETDVKSGGKKITPTNETFVELMMAPPFRGLFQMYQEDVSDVSNFRANEELEAVKN